MRTICVSDEQGICIQCGAKMPVHFLRTCPQGRNPIVALQINRHQSLSIKGYRSTLVPTLEDTAERNGQIISVKLLHPPCQHMGAKRFFKDGSPKTAKQTGCCGGGVVTFTPTYECAIFGKCAPFAAKIEDDFDRTQPCRGCEKHSQNNLESASASHSQ